MLSLSVFWGFLLVSPFWCLSLVSNDNFLPYALQMGLIITLIIIVEALPFVALMHDARSKIYHVLYAAYLLLGWREVCVYLVSMDTLGRFAAQTWIRNICYMIAGAATLGCGAVGWSIWDGVHRRVWIFTVISLLLFLQITHQIHKLDNTTHT